ncbi:hypothetical protein JXA32_09110 [Candidatus Sumerlaeota bacterium]|nr:hypothetical protein [Candidatus Sumerlaeota bacterium]
MSFRRMVKVSCLMLMLFGSGVNAAPQTIAIQGAIASAGDEALAGERAYRVRFYDQAASGSQLGADLTGIVTVSGSGRFVINVVPPVEVFSSTDVYYELAIDSSATPDGSIDADDVFPGRVQVHSVLYAQSVVRQGSGSGLDADTLDGSDSTAFAAAGHTHNLGSLSGTADQARSIVHDFAVAAGESVTAGDVVAYVNGAIRPYDPASTWLFSSVFDADQCSQIDAVALSGTRFVVVYRDGGNSSYGTAIIGDVSGATITWSAPQVFNNGTSSYLSVSALSENRILVAYWDNGVSVDQGAARIGDITSGTFTWGAEAVFNDAESYYVDTLALTATSIVVAYRDDGNSYYGTAIAGSITGNAIYWGAESVFNAGSTADVSLARQSDTRFLAAFRDIDNSSAGTAIIGALSGSDIDFGDEYVFSEHHADQAATAVLPDGSVLIAYIDYDNGNFGTAVICRTNGLSIDPGAPQVIFPVSSMYPSLDVLPDSRIVAVFRDQENYPDYFGYAIVGSWEHNSVSWSEPYPVTDYAIFFVQAVALGDGDFAVIGADDGTGSEYIGTAVIATAGDSSGNVAGIAQTSASAGADCTVVMQGISDQHTGLTPWRHYFATSGGSLTSETSSAHIGRAISTTELLLDVH